MLIPERWISVILIIVCSLLYIATYSFRILKIDPFGSVLFPRVVLILIILLAVLLYIFSKSSVNNESVKDNQIGNQDDINSMSEKKVNNDVGLVLLFLLLCIIYVIIIPILGFYFSTFVFLFLFLWVLGDRNTKKIPTNVFISLIFTIIIYLFFQKVVYIMFPQGLFL